MIPIVYDRRTMTAREKEAKIRELAIEGAETQPNIREIAVRLVRGTERGRHIERLGKLLTWVQSIDYHREPIEMFHRASTVAGEGGDCDDLVILLGALAWSLKYPFRVRPIGHPDGPRHYSIQLGFPESETPDGDTGTAWVWAEASGPAFLGEHPLTAEQRLSARVG